MSLPLRLALGVTLLTAAVAAGQAAPLVRPPVGSPDSRVDRSPDSSPDGRVDRSPVTPPATVARLYPALSATSDGSVLASWMERSGEATTLRFARWRDGAWGAAGTVATGAGWLVNWADFPSVVEVPGGGMAASWLVLRPGRGAYDVRLAWSGDGGVTWSAPHTPHGDGTATEHGFVSLFPHGGEAAAVWLDGRAYAESPDGPMSLRWAPFGADAARQHDGAAALPQAAAGRATSPQDGAVLDPRICDCCQTDAAATADGAVVVYRDRSSEEIRDIWIVRLEDGRWSEPTVVHEDGWRIEACPVNGPAVAADGDGVAVAWFTAAGDDARVNVAFSADGGRSFGAPVRIDDGAPMGRVDLLLVEDGQAMVSWVERTETSAEVRLRRVSATGRAGASRAAGAMDPGRASGFPRMARAGDTVLLAWTVPGEPADIRFATVDLGRR